MKFTIVMPSKESDDISVGCLFTPCLVWKIGSRKITPHRDNPNYLPGDFQSMLEKTNLGKRIEASSKKVALISHNIGHGTQSYRELLRADIQEAGFEVCLVDL